MTKTKLILLCCFLLVFVAGGSLGLLAARSGKLDKLVPPPPPSPRPPSRSRLADELKLSTTQREEMGRIWSQIPPPWSRDAGEKRHVLTSQRDQQIRDLFTPAQLAKYEAIQKDFVRAMEELAAEGRKPFDEAVRKTRAILTAEQFEKYQEIMRRQRERERGPRDGFGPPWRGGFGPRTRPDRGPGGERGPGDRGPGGGPGDRGPGPMTSPAPPVPPGLLPPPPAPPERP